MHFVRRMIHSSFATHTKKLMTCLAIAEGRHRPSNSNLSYLSCAQMGNGASRSEAALKCLWNRRSHAPSWPSQTLPAGVLAFSHVGLKWGKARTAAMKSAACRPTSLRSVCKSVWWSSPSAGFRLLRARLQGGYDVSQSSTRGEQVTLRP